MSDRLQALLYIIEWQDKVIRSDEQALNELRADRDKNREEYRRLLAAQDKAK